MSQTVSHRPLFAPRLGWPFLGGVIIAPIAEEITFGGAVFPGLLRRDRVIAANTLRAVFFLGIHLPGWYLQGRLWTTPAHPRGEYCRY